jgi:hypothetical protein
MPTMGSGTGPSVGRGIKLACGFSFLPNFMCASGGQNRASHCIGRCVGSGTNQTRATPLKKDEWMHGTSCVYSIPS